MTKRRIHFIAEWAEQLQMRQADIVKQMDTNKSTMSKWFGGTLPSEKNLIKLAKICNLEPYRLFRHPDDDELLQLLDDKTHEQKQKIIAMIKAALSL